MRQKILFTISLLALSIIPTSSYAQIFSVPAAYERSAIRINIGLQGAYNRVEVAYESPTLWQTQVFNRPFDVKLEASFANWYVNHPSATMIGSRSNIWQVGLTPMFRWWATPQWYVEAGVGATMLSHTRFSNKELSTMFQFGDHLGVVRTFGNDWRVGLRLSHFSNASIKAPNPGLNIVQLTFAHSF